MHIDLNVLGPGALLIEQRNPRQLSCHGFRRDVIATYEYSAFAECMIAICAHHFPSVSGYLKFPPAQQAGGVPGGGKFFCRKKETKCKHQNRNNGRSI